MDGVAMVIPAGKASKNSKVTISASFAVLSMVNVKVLIPPRGMVSGLKLFEKPGRPGSTVSVASVGPWLPALEVRSPVVFKPVAVAVTLTVTTHALEAPSLAPLRLMVVPPSGAVSTASTQLVNALAGSAIVIPVGKVSVKARSETGSELLLVISNRSVEALPGPMVAGVNDLLNAGTGTWA